MGVEHEWAGVIVGELEHGAFALAQGDDIGPLVTVQIGSGAVQPEEVAVHVERVEQVEFGHVDEVHPDQLVPGAPGSGYF